MSTSGARDEQNAVCPHDGVSPSHKEPGRGPPHESCRHCAERKGRTPKAASGVIPSHETPGQGSPWRSEADQWWPGAGQTGK